MLGGRVTWLCADEACWVCTFFLPLVYSLGSLMPVFFQCELTPVYVPPNIAGCGFRLTPGTAGDLVGC